MSSEPILTSTATNGIATVTLNRPEVHNAFDDAMIAELTNVFRRLNADEKVRLVILAANGKTFSAGADLNWIRRTVGDSKKQILHDSQALADLMHTLRTRAPAQG